MVPGGHGCGGRVENVCGWMLRQRECLEGRRDHVLGGGGANVDGPGERVDGRQLHVGHGRPQVELGRGGCDGGHGAGLLDLLASGAGVAGDGVAVGGVVVLHLLGLLELEVTHAALDERDHLRHVGASPPPRGHS